MLTSTLFPLLFVQNAIAFDINVTDEGNETHWSSTPVEFTINPSGSHELDTGELEDAIVNAASAWHGHSGDIEFNHSGETEESGADFADGQHTVSFVDNWTNDSNLLALTFVWYNNDGDIQHMDIEINSNHDWSTSGEEGKMDLMNAMTHEFGHALGFGHSESEEATMAPTATPGETIKQDLAQDDIDALLHVYPSGSLSGTDDGGTDNSNSQSGSSQTGGGSSSSGGSITKSSGGSSSGGGFPMGSSSGGCSYLAPPNGVWALFLGVLGFARRQRQNR
jgi:hypothetical protein